MFLNLKVLEVVVSLGEGLAYVQVGLENSVWLCELVIFYCVSWVNTGHSVGHVLWLIYSPLDIMDQTK